MYGILFVVVFAETGLVVTPFLPGDSLLFATGALAAVDTSGTLDAPIISVMLGVAAVLGNTVNYAVGHAIGPAAFSGRHRFLKVEYLRRTEEFFARHGGMAIFLSRFMPIIRTFAPFVAGVGRMPYAPLSGLQRRGWLHLGDAVHLGRLPVRQHPGREAELRAGHDFHHHRVAVAAGGHVHEAPGTDRLRRSKLSGTAPASISRPPSQDRRAERADEGPGEQYPDRQGR